jgi:hypothetical protein
LVRYEVNAVMEDHGGSPRAFARVRVRWPFTCVRCNVREAALVPPGSSVGGAGCAQARDASHSHCRTQNW